MKLITMTNNLAEKILQKEKELNKKFAIIPDNTHRSELTTLIYDEVKAFLDANDYGGKDE